MLDFTELWREAKENIRQSIDVDLAVGTPVRSDNATMIPIFKISYAFVSGGAEIQKEPNQNPFAVLGGGATVTPIGFFVTENSDYNFIKAQGDATDKWFEILQKLIKK